MIQVAPHLFVGSGADEAAVRRRPGWFVVSAAKEPWHREALGYSGRSAPKDHHEYLAAPRTGALILNLIDADDPAYIPEVLINLAVETINEMLSKGADVLVHCNQGLSRSPTIALLYLRQYDPRFAFLSYEAAVDLFKTIYPPYAPAKGMALYAEQHWPHREAA